MDEHSFFELRISVPISSRVTKARADSATEVTHRQSLRREATAFAQQVFVFTALGFQVFSYWCSKASPLLFIRTA